MKKMGLKSIDNPPLNTQGNLLTGKSQKTCGIFTIKKGKVIVRFSSEYRKEFCYCFGFVMLRFEIG